MAGTVLQIGAVGPSRATDTGELDVVASLDVLDANGNRRAHRRAVDTAAMHILVNDDFAVAFVGLIVDGRHEAGHLVAPDVEAVFVGAGDGQVFVAADRKVVQALVELVTARGNLLLQRVGGAALQLVEGGNAIGVGRGRHRFTCGIDRRQLEFRPHKASIAVRGRRLDDREIRARRNVALVRDREALSRIPGDDRLVVTSDLPFVHRVHGVFAVVALRKVIPGVGPVVRGGEFYVFDLRAVAEQDNRDRIGAQTVFVVGVVPLLGHLNRRALGFERV